MKIPGRSHLSTVQSLGRQDPSAPGRAAASAMSARAAEGKVSEAIAGVVGQLSEEYYGRKMQEDETTFTTEQAAFVADLKSRSQEKPFYTAGEVDEDLDIPLEETIVNAQGEEETVLRQSIPSYEVYPELFIRRATKSAQTRASKIHDVKLREKLLNAEIEDINNTYAKLKVAGDKAAQQDKKDLMIANMKNNVTLGNYGVARLINSKAFISDAEKKINRDWINQTEEVDSYEQILATDDIDQMQKVLDNTLVLEQKKYVDKGGNLDANSRENYARKFRSRIESEKNAAKQALQDSVVLANEDAQDKADYMNGGNSLPVIEVNNVLNDPLVSPKIKRHVKEASIVQPYITEIYATRTVDLTGYKPSKGQTSGSGIRMTNTLEKHVKQRAEDMIKSPLIVAQKSGNKEFTLNKIDFQNFGESMMKRNGIVEKITTHYASYNGLMLPSEASELASHVNKLNPNKKLAFITSLTETTSPVVQREIYEQLKMTKEAPAFSMAGRMMVAGKSALAEDILFGLENLKNFKVKPKQDLLNYKLNKLLSGVFQENPAEQAAIMEATRLAYYTAMSRAGTEGETIKGETLELILNKINGGPVISFGSSNITPPVEGMTSGQFTDWLTGVQPEYIDTLGGLQSHSNTQFLRDVHSGKIQLNQVSRTQFVAQDVQAVDGQLLMVPLKDKMGKIFIFKYSDDVNRVQYSRDWKGTAQKIYDVMSNLEKNLGTALETIK